MSEASALPSPTELDDEGALAIRDPHAVRQVLAGFPAQCRQARELLPSRGLGGRPRPPLVVVAGMGGSAAGGDLLAAVNREPVPVIVHRGYDLPAAVGEGTLVIASSYSGDTVETLSAVRSALDARVAVCAVTSGGELGTLATRHGLPMVTLPRGFMPRFAFGHLFFPLLRLLAGAGLTMAPPAEVDEAMAVVEGMARELIPTAPAPHNEAKRLARELEDRLPVVYGGQLTASTAYRWKTDLEENAKRLAVAGALPEMNHNELEGWRAPDARRFHAIFLRSAGEPGPIQARFEILREMLAGAAGGISETWARGEGRLARLLSLIYLGQWTSYYAATRRGVDPWPILRLDEVKRRLPALTRERDA